MRADGTGLLARARLAALLQQSTVWAEETIVVMMGEPVGGLTPEGGAAASRRSGCCGCALIWPYWWHWPRYTGSAGRGSSAVDSVGRGDDSGGGVGGRLSAALQQRKERRQATQWQLGYQDQLIEHRQERRHGPGRRSKGSGSSSGFKTTLISSVLSHQPRTVYVHTVQSTRLKSPRLLNRERALAKNTKTQPQGPQGSILSPKLR